MKKYCFSNIIVHLLFIFIFLVPFQFAAQEIQQTQAKSPFWQNIQIGGAIALGFGSGYTNIGIAPSAIYNINKYVGVGAGVQYSYLKEKGFYSSQLYGGSVIGLFNPIEQVQLSVEIEQLRANVSSENSFYISDDFWNTGLFFGAGYRMNNVTIGGRYNVLFQEDKGVYGAAFIPFVRVFF